jgi:ribonuclease-3
LRIFNPFAALLKRLLTYIGLTPSEEDDCHFYQSFYQQFGFKPTSLSLYRVALAHRSAPYKGKHNERLEFLGDAILSSILAEVLYKAYPDLDEGALTRMRSTLAKRSTLNEWSKALGIPNFLQFDQSLNRNPQCSDTLYGNALEALIGAIFMDKGYGFTKNYVNQNILTPLVDFRNLVYSDTNYKSRLTEWAQKTGNKLDFHLDHQNTPGANPLFQVSAWLNDQVWSRGTGNRKKEAEQEAARLTLEKLRIREAS